jgi:hypothetical protein
MIARSYFTRLRLRVLPAPSVLPPARRRYAWSAPAGAPSATPHVWATSRPRYPLGADVEHPDFALRVSDDAREIGAVENRALQGSPLEQGFFAPDFGDALLHAGVAVANSFLLHIFGGWKTSKRTANAGNWAVARSRQIKLILIGNQVFTRTPGNLSDFVLHAAKQNGCALLKGIIRCWHFPDFPVCRRSAKNTNAECGVARESRE